MLLFSIVGPLFSAWAQQPPAAPGPAPVDAEQQAPSPEDPELAWAKWEQSERPAWIQRRLKAEAQLAARTAFLAGERTFELAFPELAGAHLGSLPVVRGRLDALQRQDGEREMQRQEPVEFGDPQRDTSANAVRTATLDVEERSDNALRTVLTRIEAFLRLHPELSDEGLARFLKPLEATMATQPATDDLELARQARAAAAVADAELAAWRHLQHQLTVGAIGGESAYDPSADQASLAVPERAEQAYQRLRIATPLLSPAIRPAVLEQVVAYATGPALEAARAELERASRLEEAPPAALAPEAAKAEVDSLAAQVASLEARVAGLEKDDPRQAYLPTQLAAARVRLNLATKRMTALVADRRQEAAEADAAARARQEAEAAQAAAVDDTQKRAAELLTAAADAGDRLVAVNNRTNELEAAAAQERATFIQELETYAALLDQAEKSSSLVRVTELDSRYGKLRTRLIQLHESDTARGRGADAAREEAEAIRAVVAEDQAKLDEFPASKASEEWARTLDRELAGADEIVAIADRAYTDTLAHLRALADKRRALRPYIDFQEQNADQATWPREVVLESGVLLPSMGTLIQNRAHQIVQFPGRLVANGKLMGDLIGALVWLAILVAAWSWARGKAELLASRLGMQLHRFRPDLRPLDLLNLKKPLTVALAAGIDLALGYLMMGRISELSGEIGLLVQCWLLLALFRFLLAVFDLGVVRASEFRPAVVVLAPAAFDRVRYSARIAFIWMIGKGFVYYLVWTILGMDATSNLLMLVFNLLGLGLLIVIAHSWYPMLRERMEQRNQESRLVAFLSRDVPVPLHALAALAMLAFFAITIVSDLWHFAIAHDRTGLAKLFNVVSRYQIDQSETFDAPSDATCAAICESRADSEVYIARPGVDDEVIHGFNEWLQESRRGLVAIVGDRGAGKRTEVERFVKHVQAEGMPLRRTRFRDALVDPHAMYARIAHLAGVEPTEDVEQLIARLREVERTVLVVEQAHRGFSRAVGGFDAIQALLYIMNATSNQHFWLVTVHGPAWNFLAAIPSLVDVGVFRSVVKLAPFNHSMVRELCEGRMAQAGIKIDYAALVRNNLLGADPKVELERATNTFYRLLAESSDGNPRVALYLFTQTLEQAAPHLCIAHTTWALSTDVAADLGIEAMFALVAIRQQDTMLIDEVSEVTNLPIHAVRNLVRDLQSRKLLEQLDEQLYIPITALPMVTRTLRRRHLMHLGT